MLSKDKIARINELVQLSKTRGLTDKEKNEQAALRKEYISEFRKSFKNQLDSIKIQ